MPFVENGGFFLPTTRECRIGDPVLVMIRRGETGESLGVPGKVVWITPSGAERNRVQGVGVQFDKKCGQVRDWIE